MKSRFSMNKIQNNLLNTFLVHIDVHTDAKLKLSTKMNSRLIYMIYHIDISYKITTYRCMRSSMMSFSLNIVVNTLNTVIHTQMHPITKVKDVILWDSIPRGGVQSCPTHGRRALDLVILWARVTGSDLEEQTVSPACIFRPRGCAAKRGISCSKSILHDYGCHLTNK